MMFSVVKRWGITRPSCVGQRVKNRNWVKFYVVLICIVQRIDMDFMSMRYTKIEVIIIIINTK